MFIIIVLKYINNEKIKTPKLSHMTGRTEIKLIL